MELKDIGNRFIECVACLMLLFGGVLALGLPSLAPFVHMAGLRVNSPMILIVPFAWGIGLPFLAVGLALWPARLAVVWLAPRLVARYPKLGTLNAGSWVGGIVVGGFGMIMPSVAFLYYRPTGPGWEGFWILLVLGTALLLVAVLIASPLLRGASDTKFYVITAVMVTFLAAVMILVAASRATGGNMTLLEPILWGVCAILVAIAGATWRNAWREIRSARGTAANI